MKTSDLIGPALDWAVAKCEGEEYSPDITYSGIGAEYPATEYSTNWSQGGPIIERECICIMTPPSGEYWDARPPKYPPIYLRGPTSLIAAMRCYVASKLGDDIEIPEELK